MWKCHLFNCDRVRVISSSLEKNLKKSTNQPHLYFSCFTLIYRAYLYLGHGKKRSSPRASRAGKLRRKAKIERADKGWKSFVLPIFADGEQRQQLPWVARKIRDRTLYRGDRPRSLNSNGPFSASIRHLVFSLRLQAAGLFSPFPPLLQCANPKLARHSHVLQSLMKVSPPKGSFLLGVPHARAGGSQWNSRTNPNLSPPANGTIYLLWKEITAFPLYTPAQ